MHRSIHPFILSILALSLAQACGLDPGGDLSSPGQEALESRSVAGRDDASSLDTSAAAVQPLSRASSAEPQRESRLSGVTIFAGHGLAPSPEPGCIPSYGNACTVSRLFVRVEVDDGPVRNVLPGFDGLERVQVRVPFRASEGDSAQWEWVTLSYDRTRPQWYRGALRALVDEFLPSSALLLVDTRALEHEGIEVRLETNRGTLEAGRHRVFSCMASSVSCAFPPRVGWSVGP